MITGVTDFARIQTHETYKTMAIDIMQAGFGIIVFGLFIVGIGGLMYMFFS